ncbi:MAG: hypothetical protein ABW090_17630 [Sedimenticola sp.]
MNWGENQGLFQQPGKTVMKLFKNLFCFVLLIYSFNLYGMAPRQQVTVSVVNKIEVIWVDPPPSGQPYEFYANGNQQAPIAVKVYLSNYEPNIKPENVFNNLKFYQQNTRDYFGKDEMRNGGLVTLKKNGYQHGIFKQNSNQKPPIDFIGLKQSYLETLKKGVPYKVAKNGNCQYTKEDKCYLLNIYFQTNQVAEHSICTDYQNNEDNVVTTCGLYPKPILYSAFYPIKYSDKDFIISRKERNWRNDVFRFWIWDVVLYKTVDSKPDLIKFYPTSTVKLTSQACSWGSHEKFSQCTGTVKTSTDKTGIRTLYFLDKNPPSSDPNRLFYTGYYIAAVFGIPVVSKSYTSTETFFYTDVYGNSGSTVIRTCFGDAC